MRNMNACMVCVSIIINNKNNNNDNNKDEADETKKVLIVFTCQVSEAFLGLGSLVSVKVPNCNGVPETTHLLI